MTIIAKPQVIGQPIYSENYELFQPVTMTGIDGTEVQVLQSIGVYSLNSLVYQKEQLELQIADVESKIAAIQQLQTV